MRLIFCLLIAWSMSQHFAQAQNGGRRSFAFLNLPQNSNQAALGGINISMDDAAKDGFLSHPALLCDSTSQYMSWNTAFFYGGTQYYTLAYSTEIKNTGVWGFSLQYMNYGTFDGYDDTGASTGAFQARDYAIAVTKNHKSEAFVFGATLRAIGSRIAGFKAGGVALDAGGLFIHPERDMKFGVLVKNAGIAYGGYQTDQARMPFDAQIGFTYSPGKMPFRLSLTAHHLYKFDLSYTDPSLVGQVDIFGNPVQQDLGWGAKSMQHLVVGLELVPSKSFSLRMGYNYLQRTQLRLDNYVGLTGFSFGAKLNAKNWSFAFTRSIMHTLKAYSSIALSINTQAIFKKKTVVQ